MEFYSRKGEGGEREEVRRRVKMEEGGGRGMGGGGMREEVEDLQTQAQGCLNNYSKGGGRRGIYPGRRKVT